MHEPKTGINTDKFTIFWMLPKSFITHSFSLRGRRLKGKGKGVLRKGSFKFERNARDVVSRPNSLPLPFPTPATQATTHFVNDLYTLYNRLNAISRFRKKHENM